MFTLHSVDPSRVADAINALAAQVGRDALIKRLKSEADARPDGPGPAQPPLVDTIRRAATARCYLAYLDGGDAGSLTEAATVAATETVLREVLSARDPDVARADVGSTLFAASTHIERQFAQLADTGLRALKDTSAADGIATYATVAERREWLAARLPEMIDADDKVTARYGELAHAAIVRFGGVEAVGAGLAAVENARSPIDSDPSIKALKDDLAGVESSLSQPDDAGEGWGREELSTRADKLRADLGKAREMLAARRRADANRLAARVGGGDWVAGAELVKRLHGVTAAQAGALRSAIDMARREAVAELAPAMLSAIRAGQFISTGPNL